MFGMIAIGINLIVLVMLVAIMSKVDALARAVENLQGPPPEDAASDPPPNEDSA